MEIMTDNGDLSIPFVFNGFRDYRRNDTPQVTKDRQAQSQNDSRRFWPSNTVKRFNRYRYHNRTGLNCRYALA